MKKIRVWDLPVRLFHWTLVILLITTVLTQKIDGIAIRWHLLSGYAILTLLLFRIVWGLVGSCYVRFANFFHSPRAVLAYLRHPKTDAKQSYHGHSPLGSLSVFALLLVLLAQVLLGVFSNDGTGSGGPMAQYINKELSDSFNWLHRRIAAPMIAALVALHIVAIVYYAVHKKQNLIVPMITGDKVIDSDGPSANDSWTMRLFATAILAVCAVAVCWTVNI